MNKDEFTSVSTDNIEGFERSNCKIIDVKNQNHLEKLVYFASENNLKIYPISGGKNWGYGSHLPIKDNTLILNLSSLDEILNIDEEQGIATIGPGVTQAQLALELKKRKSRFFLDVTGSGADTSILGNSLERGIAYRELRAKNLVDFEVLLMDGTRFKTGFGDFEKTDLYGLYPYGLGPNVQGLFFQSNLGIITEGCIRLNRIQEKRVGMTLFVDDSNLSNLVSKIKDLSEEGLLEGIPHIGNKERVRSTLIPHIENKMGHPLTSEEYLELSEEILADWMVTLFVSGKKEIVKTRCKEIRNGLSSLGVLYTKNYDEKYLSQYISRTLQKIIFSSFKNKVIEASSELSQFHLGNPSDAGIKHLQKEGTVQKSKMGFLLCTPLAPLRGQSALKLMKILKLESSNYKEIQTAVTLNVISDHILEAVISLYFEKDENSLKAQQLLKKLTEAYCKNGFYPYRLNINQMRDVNRLRETQSVLLQKIKKLVDPKSILASGRYIE